MDTDRIARRTSRSSSLTTDRHTGRQYRLVKRYSETGRYMESSTLRRYDLFKQYV